MIIDSTKILGVKVDKVSLDQALDLIQAWLSGKGKHFIVTPNPEFILAARTDPSFKQILNQADLAVPDSARLGWADKVLRIPNHLFRLAYLPFGLAPALVSDFPVTTGVDLMDQLCKLSSEKGYTIGLIGGQKNIAKKTAECLKQCYPGLKISLAEAGPRINSEGMEVESTDFKSQISNLHCDILFVAFGQVKQEKWINRNLADLDIKLAIGVGGAFDYISGAVPRAPEWLRRLGFEWLFRLIIQPWRLRRQLKLIYFVWLVLTA